MSRIYLTTTIPYGNAPPHLGHALEFVQADVLARHHRQRAAAVRLLTGTDDNSLKNVLAAEHAGVDVATWVDRHAAAIAALREPLALSYDDFIRTSQDPRHAAGVARLWHACAAAGDLYRDRYEGLYCIGCESYYTQDELVEGRCREHGVPPQPIAEENWFFRLSRYAPPLREAITSGRLRIEPATRRNEVLAFIDAGLRDFSVSRSAARARGWGIPVPGEPQQVIYVWWDALGSYITSLGYGHGAAAYRRWWHDGDRRIHVLGKGVLRFHAVYWPAMLLSAGLPLPTDIYVHDYLTIDGQKISKSTGGGADPQLVVRRYGTDAVRWWLLRDVARHGDTDFAVARLVARADADLAGGFGNLVHRVVTMLHRYRNGRVPATVDPTSECAHAVSKASTLVEAALGEYDLRSASAAVMGIVDELNRYVERVRPWQLARAERDGHAEAGARLDAALGSLVHACQGLAWQLVPFLPGAAASIADQCTPRQGRLPQPRLLFTRLGDHASGNGGKG